MTTTKKRTLKPPPKSNHSVHDSYSEFRNDNSEITPRYKFPLTDDLLDDHDTLHVRYDFPDGSRGLLAV
jgi:hypothetical protein